MTSRRAFSVSIFCRNEGAVLLIRHRRLRQWLPIGGEIEPGETPLEAARRELREETGLDGQFPVTAGVEGCPPGLIGYEEHAAGSKGLHMNFAFVADVPTRALAPCDEYDDVVWVQDVGLVDCPNNVRQLLARALSAIGF
jgi:8-oxo-dGTP diphosphatase